MRTLDTATVARPIRLIRDRAHRSRTAPFITVCEDERVAAPDQLRLLDIVVAKRVSEGATEHNVLMLREHIEKLNRYFDSLGEVISAHIRLLLIALFLLHH